MFSSRTRSDLCEDGLSSRHLPQHPDMVNMEAIALVPTKGLYDTGCQQLQHGKTCPKSPLSLKMSEQIKSGPLGSSGMEKWRETLWKSSRMWECDGSEGIYKENYLLSMLCTQSGYMKEAIDFNV